MSKIKKNFGYNLLLTASGYIFPFLTFPYISRVLGPNNVGIVNFATSVIDYFILFSTLGISVVGMREIAGLDGEKSLQSKKFSQLLSLHFVFSFVVLLIYVISIFVVPQLAEHKVLYLIGASKIILNVFLIEWLFKGLQDFKYITIRSLVTRFLYVIAIFVFVRKKEDFDIYFIITLGQIFLNAIINWQYGKKYVSFSFSLRNTRQFVYPLFCWGISMILLSFYATFNVLFLGFTCGNSAVGYYTTATKLYAIILSVLGAYNGVYVPHLNSLRAKGDMDAFKKAINNSFRLVQTYAIPLVVFCFILAPEIILLIAGEQFSQSILPFRIVLFQVIIIGISQITHNQILLSLKKDKEILISTIAGVTIMIIMMLLFVPQYAQIGAACSTLLSHIVEFIFLFYFARKSIKLVFPFALSFKIILYSIPIGLICIVCKLFLVNIIVCVMFAALFSMLYYVLLQYLLIKDPMVIKVITRMKSIIMFKDRKF